MAKPLVEQFRQVVGGGLVDQARGDHRHHQHHGAAHHFLARGFGGRGHLRHPVVNPATGHEQSQGQACRHAHQPGHDKGRPPAHLIGEKAGDQGRAGDPGGAEKAGDAQSLAAIFGIPHQPGDADRMIDRGEQTHQSHAHCQADHALGQTGQDRRRAGADKVDHHHFRRAPLVAQPAGGQSGGAKQDAARQHQHHQHAIGLLPVAFQGQDHGRKQQHEHMRVTMADTGKHQGQARGTAISHDKTPEGRSAKGLRRPAQP